MQRIVIFQFRALRRKLFVRTLLRAYNAFGTEGRTRFLFSAFPPFCSHSQFRLFFLQFSQSFSSARTPLARFSFCNSHSGRRNCIRGTVQLLFEKGRLKFRIMYNTYKSGDKWHDNTAPGKRIKYKSSEY